jgi:hypothetical protein
MLRKRLLFLSLASLASIAALIAWGFAPADATPASASAAPAEIRTTQITSELPPDATPACALASSAKNRAIISATSAQNPCVIQASVNPPILSGTPASPASVRVTWSITNVPTCYRLVSKTITFTITRNNAPNIVRVVNAPGTGTSGSTSVSLSDLGQNLPAAERINGIIVEVRQTAEPEDPIKARTFSSSATF